MLPGMRRGVSLYLVGSFALASLAGCGRSWLGTQAREPWRHEAEVACLKAGGVRQSVLITPASAISGPGICGADYPFKVAGLGGSAALGFTGFADSVVGRPAPFSATRQDALSAASAAGRAAPLADEPPASLRPPGHEHDGEEGDDPTLDALGTDAGGAGDGASASPRLGPTPAVQALAAGPASFAPTATLACPMISALENWITDAVQPAAAQWFGVPVVEIKQISAYSCRGMNGQPGAKISEHAFGNALDIAAFTLADGRRVVVRTGWHGAPEEQGFLRDVQGAACRQFSTVLAPGSNRFHYDHIHVDLARHRGGRRYCNPKAVPGEVVAARARSEAIVAGSVWQRAAQRLGFAPERGDESPPLPRAIPGAD